MMRYLKLYSTAERAQSEFRRIAKFFQDVEGAWVRADGLITCNDGDEIRFASISGPAEHNKLRGMEFSSVWFDESVDIDTMALAQALVRPK